MTVKKVLKKIIRNGIEYEFPTNGGGGGGSDLDIGGVSAIVDMKLGDYDSLFSITSGLYKILNAIDTDDEIGLTSGESWSQIVSSATSMSKISHCYAVMCYIANSSVAMNQIVGNSSATKEISECWNSITIIAENQLSSDIYLGSVNGLTYLFAYTTAQDAFFTSTERKTEIISDNIMVIVNNNTLLTNINDDPVVEAVIASSEEAMLAIVASTDKLDIVDENSVIMTGIATNASALTAMSDQNFTSYILEDHDYLVACTSDDDGKARINSMAADDLLPAIFYWTGLSGYSTFADLAANDSAMEIVQSSTEAMLIIQSNDEAEQYIGYQPNENTQAYFDLKTDFTDKSGNNRNATVNGWSITQKGVAYSSISNSTFSFSCPWVATRTIAVWVKYTGGSASTWRNISWVGGQTNGYYHGMFVSANSTWDLTVRDGMDAVSSVGVDNNWHLLVGVFSSGNSKLYLDKNLIATNTNGIGTGNGNGRMFSKGGNEAFIGYVGEIIIEEGNWTESQIADYYDLVKRNYPNS